MKRKMFQWLGAMVLMFAASIGAQAQNSRDVHLSGLINDYTPKTVNPTGTWEVRGEWSMAVRGNSGKADFSATLTMVRSDYWVITLGDPDDPQSRTPHTHHVSLSNGDVTTTDHGFRVTGMATITASGNPAGFSPSMLTIDVTGGSSVPYSNIQLTFDTPASGHFGTQPLDGVVRRSPNGDNQQR